MLGIVLMTRPFSSLGVLVVLVAANFIVTGINELTDAGEAASPGLQRAIGVGWIAAGIAAVLCTYVNPAVQITVRRLATRMRSSGR